MTREELLKDEWVKENFGDACYPNYLEPNFEAGVEYGERKAIEKACEWLNMNIIDYITEGSREGISLENQKLLIEDFRKAMEE